jgi:glycosyltransferase involved in cell wall biosynthesis
MKVLIVGPSITRTKGGMATVISDMLQNNRNPAIQFEHIVSHAEGSALEKIMLTISTFFKVLTRSDYDVVHIHVASGASFFRKSLVVWACRMRRKPVIMHVHGADFDTFYHHSASFIRSYIRKTFAACNKVLVLSGYWKGFFDNFIYRGNTEILHNGVYTHVYKPYKTAPANITKFLFLGRLGQRKGVYDLLEVVTRLVNRYPNYDLTFYLAGDGELEQVKEIIVKNNLQKHVQLLGWLNEEEKMKWFRQVDTIVLPSYNEGLPMAILEAMAGGKIIISSKVGGIPDLVKEGENGFLIQPGDVDSLEKYIAYVPDHPLEMVQISRNNILKIEEDYNLAKINNRLAEIYQEISK